MDEECLNDIAEDSGRFIRFNEPINDNKVFLRYRGVDAEFGTEIQWSVLPLKGLTYEERKQLDNNIQ